MSLIFRMKPEGAFYFGDRFRESYSFPFLRSDTVFKAVLRAWETLWGSPEKLLAEFRGEKLPFSFSSVFPVVGDIHFLPIPFSMFDAVSDEAPCESIRQISWISASVLEKWTEGKKWEFRPENFFAPCLCCDSSEIGMLNTSLAYRTAWSRDPRSRNRTGAPGSPQVHDSNQIFYDGNLETYILVSVLDEYRERLEAAFRFLAHEGMGGKRSIGCGSYSYRPPQELPASLKFVDRPAGTSFVTLSLFHGKEDDVRGGLLNRARYRLVERRGIRRDENGIAGAQPMLRLFAEGSHFHYPMSGGNAAVAGDAGFFHYTFPFRIAAPGAEK